MNCMTSTTGRGLINLYTLLCQLRRHFDSTARHVQHLHPRVCTRRVAVRYSHNSGLMYAQLRSHFGVSLLRLMANVPNQMRPGREGVIVCISAIFSASRIRKCTYA